MAVVIGTDPDPLRKDLKDTTGGVEAPGVAIPVEAVAGFEIGELIGSGGFSRVYRARQVGFDRDVAIKMLNVGLDSDEERAAFERECRAVGSLSGHPNIVTVFSVAFASDGRPCLAMELYGGGTLAERVAAEGALPIDEVLTMGVELAGALQTAHDHGIFHRDIKPHNVFVSDFGTVALGDFGISSFDGDRTVTGGGRLTVHYSSPETLEGQSATVASELYSLAATLYTLAAGAKPFPRGEGQSVADLARRILLEPPPRLVADGVPVELGILLNEAMDKKPSHRPASVAAFGVRLQEIQASTRRSVTPMVIGTSVSTPPHVVATSDGSPWQTPGNRRLTSAALGGLALVALVSTALATRATGEDGSSSAPSSIAVDDDDFFSAPSTPTEITVTLVDGSVRVRWQPSRAGSVVGYEVERIGDTTAEPLTTDGAEVVFEPADDGPVCVVVRAVGQGGRLSADSDPVCQR